MLVSSPPFAHGGAEQPSRGLDAPLSDRLDQAQAAIVGASRLTNQIEVGGGRRTAILAARAVRLLPPPPDGGPQNPNTFPTPTVAPGSRTSIPSGGNDVPFQFHRRRHIDGDTLTHFLASPILGFRTRRAAIFRLRSWPCGSSSQHQVWRARGARSQIENTVRPNAHELNISRYADTSRIYG